MRFIINLVCAIVVVATAALMIVFTVIGIALEFKHGRHLVSVVLTLALATVFCVGVYLGKTRGWPFVKWIRQYWSIGIYAGDSLSNLLPAPAAANPVLTTKDVTDISAEFVADPFMIEHNGKWYMFFEVWNSKRNQGEIGLATSNDSLSWDYQQIVLKEEFHLSYPHVFKCEEQFYMIPETEQAYSVRLYRAESFPGKWSLDRVLVQGKYTDTSLFQFNGKWWLMASKGNDSLHLFYADDLTSPWTEHPKSPVIRNDAKLARLAGPVKVLDNRLIRFAQNCYPAYGSQVRAFEITELSTLDYKEEEMPESPIFKGSGTGWNAKGMHHLDMHRIDGNRWIGCVDGWRPRFLFGLKY